MAMVHGRCRSIVLGPYFYFPPFSEQFSPNALAAIFATFLRQIHFPPFLPPAMHFKQSKKENRSQEAAPPPQRWRLQAACSLHLATSGISSVAI
jgi:hypothetical protein